MLLSFLYPGVVNVTGPLPYPKWAQAQVSLHTVTQLEPCPSGPGLSGLPKLRLAEAVLFRRAKVHKSAGPRGSQPSCCDVVRHCCDVAGRLLRRRCCDAVTTESSMWVTFKQDTFLTAKAIPDGLAPDGTEVQFNVKMEDKGPTAINVKLLGGGKGGKGTVQTSTTQAINRQVYLYYLNFGCGLRQSLKLIGIWTRPAYCGLLINSYKPLARLWSDPQGFVFLRKLHSWICLTCICSFLMFLVNIWPSSLRTAAIKINSGQLGCGVRPCGLFD
jgi:hypothetical protein